MIKDGGADLSSATSQAHAAMMLALHRTAPRMAEPVTPGELAGAAVPTIHEVSRPVNDHLDRLGIVCKTIEERNFNLMTVRVLSLRKAERWPRRYKTSPRIRKVGAPEGKGPARNLGESTGWQGICDWAPIERTQVSISGSDQHAPVLDRDRAHHQRAKSKTTTINGIDH